MNQDKRLQVHGQPFLDGTIKGIKFTLREVDTLACILGRRSAKIIADLLEISPKTAESHIRNIMQKLECNSREKIIEFIEHSTETLFLKERLNYLIINNLLDKSIREAARVLKRLNLTGFIQIPPEKDSSHPVITKLLEHFNRLEITLHVSRESSLELVKKAIECADFDIKIVLGPSRSSKIISLASPQDKAKGLQARADEPIEVILTNKHNEEKNFVFNSKFESPEDLSKYASVLFQIINSIVPSNQLLQISQKLQLIISNYEHSGIEYISTQTLIKQPKQFKIHSLGLHHLWSILSKHKLISIAILIGSLLVGSFFIGQEGMASFTTNNQQMVRSDLLIPSKDRFLERSELLKMIHSALETTKSIQIISLWGIGGAGKTTLARQYAQNNKASIVWEIEAETKAGLYISFEKLGEALSNSDEDKWKLKATLNIEDFSQKEDELIKFVRERLKRQKSWLLIYDNAETFSDIRKYLPYDPELWGHGKVIITTRDSTIQNNNHVSHGIEIGELSPEDKFDLFMKTLNTGNIQPPSSTEANRIESFLTQLPSFPLDIITAGYYINITNVTLEDYLDQLKKYDNEFDQLEAGLLREATDYSKTRFSIIATSLDQVIKANPEFKGLLLIMSILNADAIPIDLLKRFKKETLVDSFILQLKKFSLLLKGESVPTYPSISIHRSVQEIILAQLIKSNFFAEHKAILIQFAEAVENYTAVITNQEEYIKCYNMVTQCEIILKHNKILPQDIIHKITLQLGLLYSSIEQLEKAKSIFQSALLAAGQNNHRLHADLNFYLGSVCREQGHLKAAIEYYLQSYQIFKKYFPNEMEDHSNVLMHLGFVYIKSGDPEMALSYVLDSLEYYNKGALHNPTLLVNIYITLAQINTAMGKIKISKEYYEKAISILKENDKIDHPMFAWVIGGYGILFIELEDFENAKKYLEQSENIFKKHVKDDNSNWVWLYGALGNVLDELGDKKRGRILIEKSLLLSKSLYTERHYAHCKSLAFLGLLNAHEKNYDQSKENLNKSLSILVQLNGPDHPTVARLMISLAKVHLLEGDLKSAEKQYLAALSLYQKNDHPDQFRVYEGLSKLYKAKAKEEENSKNDSVVNSYHAREKEYLEKALELVTANYPAHVPVIVKLKKNLKHLPVD